MNTGLLQIWPDCFGKEDSRFFYDDDIPIGADWVEVLPEKITEADAIIVVYSGDVRRGQAWEERFLYSNKYQKLIIPIVIGNNSNVPPDITRIQGIYADSTYRFDDIKQQVLLSLNTYSAQTKEEAKADKEAQELLQKGINSHIEGVLKRLKTLEKRQKICLHSQCTFSARFVAHNYRSCYLSIKDGLLFCGGGDSCYCRRHILIDCCLDHFFFQVSVHVGKVLYGGGNQMFRQNPRHLLRQILH